MIIFTYNKYEIKTLKLYMYHYIKMLISFINLFSSISTIVKSAYKGYTYLKQKSNHQYHQ